jgi:hypothetical protein
MARIALMSTITPDSTHHLGDRVRRGRSGGSLYMIDVISGLVGPTSVLNTSIHLLCVEKEVYDVILTMIR